MAAFRKRNLPPADWAKQVLGNVLRRAGSLQRTRTHLATLAESPPSSQVPAAPLLVCINHCDGVFGTLATCNPSLSSLQPINRWDLPGELYSDFKKYLPLSCRHVVMPPRYKSCIEQHNSAGIEVCIHRHCVLP